MKKLKQIKREKNETSITLYHIDVVIFVKYIVFPLLDQVVIILNILSC